MATCCWRANQPIRPLAPSTAPLRKTARPAPKRRSFARRAKAYRDPTENAFMPRYYLQMQPDQRYAIVVIDTRARASIYTKMAVARAFRRRLLRHARAARADKLVEGDKKTPIGVYHVTANLPRQKGKPADLYGSGGAFRSTIRTNGTEAFGRGGMASGCTARRRTPCPPPPSDGCVVLTNQDLDAGRQEPAGRPDTGHHHRRWSGLPLDDWSQRTREEQQDHRNWRADWGKPRHGRYLPITPGVSVPAARATQFASQKTSGQCRQKMDQAQNQEPVRVPYPARMKSSSSPSSRITAATIWTTR